MRKISNLMKYALVGVATCSMAFVSSCKEDIDMSDRYTFTEYTVSSYLEQHDSTYSEYYRLLGEVKISSRSASNVLQLMSARGNFTVFAPNNDAIQEYLDSLCSKGIIDAPSWDGFRSEETLDSIRKVIVFNSIIDGKDDTEAYQTGSFPNDGEEFMLSNMNERKLTVNYGVNPDSVYINGIKDKKTKEITGGALIDLRNRDIIAINGCIHQMHQVVAPSNETLGDLLKKYIDLDDEMFSVTAKTIQVCDLFDTLSQVKDEVYEQMYLNGSDLKDLDKHPTEGIVGALPQHRKYGFTIFAETNEFWENEIGKPAKEITVEDIKAWVIDKGYYPDATTDNNYKDTKNVLNQFVTYHILPMRLPVDKLVIHYNEKGYYYTPSSNPLSIPAYELYTTMGERRLLKLYEGGKNAPKGIYLNRFPTIDNRRQGTYYETGCDADKEGLLVNTTECRNVINGYIYPISGPLAYDEDTRNNFQKQRLRFDVAGLFPEFMNNDIRANRVSTNATQCVGIPVSETYKYLEGLDIEKGTKFYYLLGLGKSWQNLQGDELNVVGNYEMTFRLPPVPKKDIYEIRYAVQNNSSHRGMCQVYFGSDKKRMPAAGIPLDLRIGGTDERLGWEADVEGDDDRNSEVDKNMRNNGFMKGSNYYHAGGAGASTARAVQTTTRRIVVRQEMEPGKTYYIKFKSVLDNASTQFYMDYIEFCSKQVYDNPNEPEDIW